MPSPEFRPGGPDRPDIRLYVPPSDAAAVSEKQVRHETPDFLEMVRRRDEDVAHIRAAIRRDLETLGRVSDKVLNMIRWFKEAWQDFRFGDLIAYDEVFEESDHH